MKARSVKTAKTNEDEYYDDDDIIVISGTKKFYFHDNHIGKTTVGRSDTIGKTTLPTTPSRRKYISPEINLNENFSKENF